jgi:hypothetical protein
MINSNIAKPDPLAAIIVFGHPTSPDLPQASWFKATDIKEVKAAAEQLKLTVIELRTEAEKALAIGLHEGVLKGSGRMIVGSVTPEAYRRIEDYVRKASGDSLATQADAPNTARGAGGSAGAGSANMPTPVATAPSSNQSEPSGPTTPWDTLRVGGTVLAAYWNEEKKLEGFWPAVIKRMDKNEFVLEWRDTPDYPLGKLAKKYVAILHPEFLASGE